MPTPAWTAPETARILAFVRSVGLRVAEGATGADTFMPGMTVRGGVLLVDPDRLAWPGDLLHEAGHLAVTAPEERETLAEVSGDPAEEMAAIAWSYAAARAAGVDPALVFHAGGYGGGGDWVLRALDDGATIGQPLLACWGMTGLAGVDDGLPPYPAMTRWLR